MAVDGEADMNSDLSAVAIAYGTWPLPEDVRAKVVERISSNLGSMAFFKKVDSGSEAALLQEAKRIEGEAFTAGQTAEADQAIAIYAQTASTRMLELLSASSSPTSPSEEESEGEMLDISGGKREKLTEETATELLRPLMEPGHKYTKIRFSNRSFGKDAASVAAAGIRASKDQLRDADLSDIIAGRPEEEALEVLKEICSALEGCNLRSLNLSDNALGEKGVRACGAALRTQTKLQHLFFCNDGISEEAAAAIVELLPSSKALFTLHFWNNMSGNGGAKALTGLISDATSLVDFKFSSTRVQTEGALALTEALSKGSSLMKLDFRDNMFGVEGGLALAKLCQVHLNLREVYFADLALEDEGGIAVAEALEVGAPKLEVLDLASNELTPKAALAISMCVARKGRLRKLSLCDNLLGDEGVYIVCRALHEHHDVLEELDFGCNELGTHGAVAAAQAVADKSNFKLLNLNDNRIPSEGIKELKKILEDGKAGLACLARLDDNTEPGDEDEDEEDEDEEADELAEKVQKLQV